MIIQNKIDAAIEKITKETEAVPASGKDGAVRYAVRDALVNFCRQSQEFAESITATGKCMKECIHEIMSGVGQSISDVEVYRRAVEFWMPGTTVKAEIRVILPDVRENEAEDKPKQKVKILSLEDLLL